MGTRSNTHTGVRVLMAVAAALLLAACAKSAASTSGGGSTPGTASSTISSSSVGSVGDVLVGADARTLYLFTPEEGGTITCTGSCASTWPAVTAPSGAESASAGSGADSSMLGTVKLADGQLEVTYNGWPLHTYAGDTAAGQANGQGIGGQWFAVTASGSAAGSADASTSGSGTRGYGAGSGGGYGSGGAGSGSSGGSSSNSDW